MVSVMQGRFTSSSRSSLPVEDTLDAHGHNAPDFGIS